MSILNDILKLPREVRNADFVVRIAEGVENPDSLLDRYAVTPDIHAAFKTRPRWPRRAVWMRWRACSAPGPTSWTGRPTGR